MPQQRNGSLVAFVVGTIAFLFSCVGIGTFANIVTLVLGLQHPSVDPLVRAVASQLVGGVGFFGGLAVGVLVGLSLIHISEPTRPY